MGRFNLKPINLVAVIENILENIPADLPEEVFSTLVSAKNFTLKRIVSHGHATPPGEWLSEKQDEWVLLLSGQAGLRFAKEEAPFTMNRGDYLLIPANTPHRVEWTSAQEKTVWLALYFS
jgi:cupin 2 domain-containing protein